MNFFYAKFINYILWQVILLQAYRLMRQARKIDSPEQLINEKLQVVR